MVHVLKVFVKFVGREKCEIRRVVVSNDVISKYNLLCEKIVGLFSDLEGKRFDVQWIDSENDFIIMSSDDELAQAVANAEGELIKIYVKAHDNPEIVDSTSEANNVRHANILCDGCNKEIHGFRYKCLQCPNFDLCSTCNNENKHASHDMLKLVSPSQDVRDWVFPGWRRMWMSLFGTHNPGRRFFKPHRNLNFKMPCAAADFEIPSAPPKMPECYDSKFLENLNDFTAMLRDVTGIEVHVESCPKEKAAEAEACKKQCNNFSATSPPPDVKETPKVQQETISSAAEEEKQTVPKQAEKVEEAAAPKEQEAKESGGAIPKKQASPDSPTKEVPKQGAHYDILGEVLGCAKNVFDTIQETHGTDGWTLLNASVGKPEEADTADKKVQYPNLDGHNYPMFINRPEPVMTEQVPSDPNIANALLKMKNMGFSNEGGWLQRLLETKKGNINETLDSLYPNTNRR